jgi:DNA invertase Pin-like site-specific DNA recombinase
LKQFIETLENLKRWKINLVSLTEDVNTSTSTGMLFFQLSAMLAEYEHNNISKRTKAGLKAARARGGKRWQTQTADRRNQDSNYKTDTFF